MFSSLTVIFIVAAYMLLLFALAQYVEQRIELGQYTSNKPWVYALSLAVFHTSWTFYGSVGFASQSGLLFLGVYVGALLSICIAWFTLTRMIRAKETFHITSIADFIASRYNHSYLIAALVTLIALIGIVPYISLQLTAIVISYQIITEGIQLQDRYSEIWGLPALIITALMIAFTIIFGARRIDPTERHQGMVAALVAECIIKLAAFLIVGIFVSYWLFDGIADIAQQLRSSEFSHVLSLNHGEHSTSLWLTLIVLSFVGVQLLPRQFHVAVIENTQQQHVKTALWLFPLYMIAINLFVIPIAGAGLLSQLNIDNADYFVLLLPQQAGADLITLFAFIGGFSAATGMILITTMTLATMTTNHLILPLVERLSGIGMIAEHLLHLRWVIVTAILLLSYGFAREFSGSYILVAIGLMSFAAILQFAPAVFGALVWKRANSVGVILGLVLGFLLWGYCLAVPAFIRQGWMDPTLLTMGLFNINWLKPESLFGLDSLPAITHAVLWSMIFNGSGFILGSLLYHPKKQERKQTHEFFQTINETGEHCYSRPTGLDEYVSLDAKLEEAQTTLAQYIHPDKVAVEIEMITKDLQIAGKGKINILELLEFHRMIEHILAGSIGAASAHTAIEENIRYTAREAQDLQTLYNHLVTELNPNVSAPQHPAEQEGHMNVLQELQNKIDRLEHQTEQQKSEIDKLEHKLDVSLDKSHQLRIDLQRINAENRHLKHQLTRFLEQPQPE